MCPPSNLFLHFQGALKRNRDLGKAHGIYSDPALSFLSSWRLVGFPSGFSLWFPPMPTFSLGSWPLSSWWWSKGMLSHQLSACRFLPTSEIGTLNRFMFKVFILNISSVQFSRSVMSNSLRPHELQHARPLCPSPTPGIHSDSRPSSHWCHPAISSFVSPVEVNSI